MNFSELFASVKKAKTEGDKLEILSRWSQIRTLNRQYNSNLGMITFEEAYKLIEAFECDETRIQALYLFQREVCGTKCYPYGSNARFDWDFVILLCQMMKTEAMRVRVMQAHCGYRIAAGILARALTLVQCEATRLQIYEAFRFHAVWWSIEDAQQVIDFFSGDSRIKVTAQILQHIESQAPFRRPRNTIGSNASVIPDGAKEPSSAQFDMGVLTGIDTKAADGSLKECVVCSENEKRVAMVPCGHVCVCIGCAKQLPKPYMCPLCRAAVASALVVFC